MADQTYDVYLSSTLRDLAYTRNLIDKLFSICNWKVKESYSTDPHRALVASCLADVRACRNFVCIIGFRYGEERPHPVSQQVKSITEHEFDAAVDAELPCHIFLLSEDATLTAGDVDDPRDKVNAFRMRASADRRVATYKSHGDLLSQLTKVLLDGMVPAQGQTNAGPTNRFPALPGPLPERRAAIQASAQAVFAALQDSLPTAARPLQAELKIDANLDDQTAVWALNHLTRALEAMADKKRTKAAKPLSDDESEVLQDAVHLLIKLYLCRAFTTDGWQTLGTRPGHQLIDASDIRLLHIGAQAAQGLDFDLPAFSATHPSDEPFGRYLHHLEPDLNAGIGRNRQQQIEGEYVRRFNYRRPRPLPEQGDQALIDWQDKLRAYQRNRIAIDRRRYAVSESVGDVESAALLDKAAASIGALAMPYLKKATDGFIAEPVLVLIDAIDQCQTALHQLIHPTAPTP